VPSSLSRSRLCLRLRAPKHFQDSTEASARWGSEMTPGHSWHNLNLVSTVCPCVSGRLQILGCSAARVHLLASPAQNEPSQRHELSQTQGVHEKSTKQVATAFAFASQLQCLVTRNSLARCLRLISARFLVFPQSVRVRPRSKGKQRGGEGRVRRGTRVVIAVRLEDADSNREFVHWSVDSA
jgi:hypothetical protein